MENPFMNVKVSNGHAWSPKLLALALAAGSVSSFSSPASASTGVAGSTDARSCPSADRPASVLRSATPEIPPLAKLEGASGDVIVRVVVKPDGKLDSATISQSSGNAILDREALRVARETEFAPGVESCHPLSGSYLYKVSFVSVL
jgi:protein TonB